MKKIIKTSYIISSLIILTLSSVLITYSQSGWITAYRDSKGTVDYRAGITNDDVFQIEFRNNSPCVIAWTWEAHIKTLNSVVFHDFTESFEPNQTLVRYRLKGGKSIKDISFDFEGASETRVLCIGKDGPQVKSPNVSNGQNQPSIVTSGNNYPTPAQQQEEIQRQIREAQRNVGRMIDNQNRDREVSKQEDEEYRANSRLEAKSMNPNQGDVGDLLNGGNSKSLGISSSDERARKFGQALKNFSMITTIPLLLQASYADNGYGAFGMNNPAVSNRITSGKTIDGNDSNNGNLYSPSYNGQSDGWGNPTDVTPDLYKNAPPITVIEFFKDGSSTVQQYQQKVWSNIEFPGNGYNHTLTSTTTYPSNNPTNPPTNPPANQSTANTPPAQPSGSATKVGPDIQLLPPTPCGATDCSGMNNQTSFYDPGKTNSKNPPPQNNLSYWQQAKDGVKNQANSMIKDFNKWVEDTKNGDNLQPQWVRDGVTQVSNFISREQKAWQNLKNIIYPPTTKP